MLSTFHQKFAKPLLMPLLSILLFITQKSYCQQMTDTTILATGAMPKLISRQFSFTEGPAVDKNGNVFFTDQPNNKIWKYDTDGNLSVFVDNAGRSNGMYFDKKGNLITCADEQNQLWSISPKGKVTVLLTDYKGRKLNGPNDLWIHPKGGIYFTDPYYQRTYWTRKSPEIEGQKVYFLPKGATEAVPLIEDLKQPNGIIGTPDGRELYVADLGGGKTFKYTIKADGSLSDAQLFTSMGSDGMTLDEKGNIYLTGAGVTVFSPQGKQVAHIAIPEKWTANVTFGGKRHNQLFITASEAIYVVEMKVKGAR
jgi:gluconolactonase